MRSFNPRVREGRDRPGRLQRFSTACFNPRVREGRDYHCARAQCLSVFQSTRPRGTRRSRRRKACHKPCFNPRVREGRDSVYQIGSDSITVSIHASARDATKRRVKDLGGIASFNPRVREGRDLICTLSITQALFQSTRPRGTRHIPVLSLQFQTCFNPRVREGRDVDCPHERRGIVCFNPRVREGRDLHLSRSCFLPSRVSIHASARDATRGASSFFRPVGCFNPRVREGRDAALPRRHAALHVSIHASARDATAYKINPGRAACFNPRVREGRDEIYCVHCQRATSVSIHASARDATSALQPFNTGRFGFQSTRPRGTRRGGQVVSGAAVRFQSTRPRGTRPDSWREFGPPAVSIHASARDATEFSLSSFVRPSGFNPRVREGRDADYKTAAHPACCFNPRVREGRDDHGIKLRLPAGFQSTRPRGTRPETYGTEQETTSFNPRVREGRDCSQAKFLRAGGCFNPRVREGRDGERRRGSRKGRKFQSTRPRGTRPAAVGKGVPDFAVSIHASARDATEVRHGLHIGTKVSIHASARDATSAGDRHCTASPVSIHASARDAT